jgi:hypothetical protein
VRYSTHYRTYHYFVYRCRVEGALDIRCPISGITTHGNSEVEAIDIAFRRAYQRFPVRPGELLVVVRVTDPAGRRQAWLMEKSFERSLKEFEELMTVGQ